MQGTTDRDPLIINSSAMPETFYPCCRETLTRQCPRRRSSAFTSPSSSARTRAIELSADFTCSQQLLHVGRGGTLVCLFVGWRFRLLLVVIQDREVKCYRKTFLARSHVSRTKCSISNQHLRSKHCNHCKKITFWFATFGLFVS